MSKSLNSYIKLAEQIEEMKVGGKILANIVSELVSYAVVGMCTMDLEEKSEEIIKRLAKYEIIPIFKGYGGYPANGCYSVNNCVLHGVPSKSNILKLGDILKIDFGIKYKSMVVDHAECILVGDSSQIEYSSNIKIVKDVSEIRQNVINYIKPGLTDFEICAKIEELCEMNNYFPLFEYAGHGVGRELHEDEPSIPSYNPLRFNDKLEPVTIVEGLTFTIEPQFTCGSNWTKISKADKYSVLSKDGSLTAMCEHTILVTKNGAEILTKC